MVYTFIILVLGLLAYAALRPWIESRVEVYSESSPFHPSLNRTHRLCKRGGRAICQCRVKGMDRRMGKRSFVTVHDWSCSSNVERYLPSKSTFIRYSKTQFWTTNSLLYSTPRAMPAMKNVQKVDGYDINITSYCPSSAIFSTKTKPKPRPALPDGRSIPLLSWRTKVKPASTVVSVRCLPLSSPPAP